MIWGCDLYTCIIVGLYYFDLVYSVVSVASR